MRKVEFDEERCKGCELCMGVCPKNLITMKNTLNSMGYRPATVVHDEECISCALCARMCPDVAIIIRKED